MASLLGNLLGLISPIQVTEDGGLAIGVGFKQLNAGIKLGGSTGIEAWANAGNTYAKAGVDNAVNAYGIAGIKGSYEVGGIAGAGIQGALGYVWNQKTNVVEASGYGLNYGAGSLAWDLKQSTAENPFGGLAMVSGSETGVANAANMLAQSLTTLTGPSAASAAFPFVDGSALLASIFGSSVAATA
jgi:hypothetical protein